MAETAKPKIKLNVVQDFNALMSEMLSESEPRTDESKGFRNCIVCGKAAIRSTEPAFKTKCVLCFKKAVNGDAIEGGKACVSLG